MDGNKIANDNNVTTVRTTLPWLLLDALHRGDDDSAAEIIKQGATDSERNLLKGILAYWQEENTTAEKLLSRAAKSMSGASKAWAHFTLIQLFLDIGDLKSAQDHLGHVGRYSYEEPGDPQRLSLMVRITSARIEILSGEYNKALAILSNVLASPIEPYFKAICLYLLGHLGRLKPELYPDYVPALQQSCSLFQEQLNNRYFLALCQFELAYSNDIEDVVKIAHDVARELTILGRQREAQIAAIRASELQQQFSVGTATESQYDRVDQCLFASKAMQNIKYRIMAVADSSFPILILGDTGTGKEMLARSIHALSNRKGEFAPVNCGQSSKEMLVSELFGYEKGAYTGADRMKKGMVEQADQGTLFLDEIGELSLDGQVALLRFLQDGSFRRMGSTVEMRSSARILAATNRNLEDMVEQGTFREDLYYRLGSVCRVSIPPLNKRRDEIIPLAEEFLRRYGDNKFRFDDSARQYLIQKDYPGNIRTLDGDIKRAISNARQAHTTVITATMLYEPDRTQENSKDYAGLSVPQYTVAMTAFEKGLLVHALAVCRWNKSKTFEVLGMKKRTFYRAIKKHGLPDHGVEP